MPLIFAENEETESGITYEDRTGVSYQYPRMYRRIIQPGERFVYYRGRRKRGGGRGPQVYFGTGVVGEIRRDPSAQGRFLCDILDYRPFQSPVRFKDENGGYYESGAERRGYFQRGVRVISEDDFSRILAAAHLFGDARTESPGPLGPTSGWAEGGPSYASSETARAIEDFAVRVAVGEIRRRYPGAQVERQPRNNPGFDVLVRFLQGVLYVEVKGTERASPQFFLTEGELQFSRRHANRFRLVVVYGVDIAAGTYRLLWHEGTISAEAGFQLKPVQWACETTSAMR